MTIRLFLLTAGLLALLHPSQCTGEEFDDDDILLEIEERDMSRHEEIRVKRKPIKVEKSGGKKHGHKEKDEGKDEGEAPLNQMPRNSSPPPSQPPISSPGRAVFVETIKDLIAKLVKETGAERQVIVSMLEKLEIDTDEKASTYSIQHLIDKAKQAAQKNSSEQVAFSITMLSIVCVIFLA